MRSNHHQRLPGALAVLATIAAALVLASGASAADDNPDPDPPPATAKPNLVVSSASVVPYGTSEWEVRYTVRNVGATTAPAFHVAVQRNGVTEIKDTAHASLAPGASRSEVIHSLRPNCYLPIRVVADSTRVVTELQEWDNERWAVGIDSPTCQTQPSYRVKAVSFHAVDESGFDLGGSDEPYWVFNSVGLDGTQLSTVTRVFEGMDTGDTASFTASEGCLYRSCGGGPAPFGMGFSIQLWEHDLGEIPATFSAIADFFHEVGGIIDQWGAAPWAATAFTKVGDGLDWILRWAWADDLIGSQTYAYDPAYLAGRLPAVGGSFTDTRTYTGGDGGTYTLSINVSRTS
jgi:CARDB